MYSGDGTASSDYLNYEEMNDEDELSVNQKTGLCAESEQEQGHVDIKVKEIVYINVVLSGTIYLTISLPISLPDRKPVFLRKLCSLGGFVLSIDARVSCPIKNSSYL